MWPRAIVLLGLPRPMNSSGGAGLLDPKRGLHQGEAVVLRALFKRRRRRGSKDAYQAHKKVVASLLVAYFG